MLVRPIYTELSMSDVKKGRYTFAVNKSSTKTEIKVWVEKSFGVGVTKISTISMTGKKYRTGKKWMIKRKPDWKKAVVTLKNGQSIALFDLPAEGTTK